MSALALDTDVFVHALIGRDEERAACSHAIALVGAGMLEAEVSTAVLEEALHVLGRITGDRAWAAEQIGKIPRYCSVVALGEEDARAGIELYLAHVRLDATDAMVAASALRRGTKALLSADRAFDEVAGLRRVDPLDRAAVEALAS